MSGTRDGVTREQVLAALKDVLDPELHKSIVELDMVKDVAVTDGHVRVEALLTIGACPLRETIVDSIRAKVAAIPGVAAVEVSLGVMSAEQRQGPGGRRRGGGGPG